MKRSHVENIHKRGMVNNGVMDNIQREIDIDYIVNLLNYYIDYQSQYHFTEEEKRSILKFIVFLMYKGEMFDE